MRRVPYSRYILMSPGTKGKTHVSNWRMSPTEAAALGALAPVGDVEYRDVPETDEEKHAALYGVHPSAGRDAVAHAPSREAPSPAPKS
jgi:hypothetical protein